MCLYVEYIYRCTHRYIYIFYIPFNVTLTASLCWHRPLVDYSASLDTHPNRCRQASVQLSGVHASAIIARKSGLSAGAPARLQVGHVDEVAQRVQLAHGQHRHQRRALLDGQPYKACAWCISGVMLRSY